MIGIRIGITSSATALTAGIKKYKSIIKKNKNKYDKALSLAKSKLNRIEILISKSLTDTNVNHDDFV